MSFAAAKEFETYARDCVKLAKQDNTPPELRDQLLKMAREWMRAVIDEQEPSSELPANLMKTRYPEMQQWSKVKDD